MKFVLKNLFGVYAALIFALSLILVIPFYFFVFQFYSSKRAPSIAHQHITRNWARVLFFFYGIRVRIEGKEKLDKNTTYVFIGNHRSFLDVPAYAVATDFTIRFLAKEELTKIPLLGYVIRKLYISVNRKDKVARARSMEKMVQSIREGISVFICPEGTRNLTERPLLDFRDGAFRLAISAQVPIGVLAIIGSDDLLSPKRPVALSPGKMICRWGAPIETTGLTQADIPELKEKAAKLMLDLWQEKEAVGV